MLYPMSEDVVSVVLEQDENKLQFAEGDVETTFSLMVFPEKRKQFSIHHMNSLKTLQ